MKNKIWLIITSLIVINVCLVGLYFKYNQLEPKKMEPTNESNMISEQIQAQVDCTDNNLNLIDSNIIAKLDNHDVSSNPELIDQIQDSQHQYHIFFDVGQVLLDNSSTGAAKAVGVSNMFWYTVKHKKTPESFEIQSRLFDFIDYCTQEPRGHALFNNQKMPHLICEWAKGKINTSEVLKIVTHYQAKAQEFFKSDEEKNLVFGALNLFKPDVICNIQKPINKMVDLFDKYCENFPNQVYILSNWDRESAALIRKKFPQIFGKIPSKNIFFSGDIGELKPELNAFIYVTTKLNLDPRSCILIDDNAENIKAAKSLGWKTILHKNPERTAHKLHRITK
jgi:HAD superfamily hydrolase (TIGR01509 family)